jgi:hypothetical protein
MRYIFASIYSRDLMEKIASFRGRIVNGEVSLSPAIVKRESDIIVVVELYRSR